MDGPLYQGHRLAPGRTEETPMEIELSGVVRGEAFDAPGYARLSYALGDDDLGEGCQRIADLLAEAV